MSLLKSRLFARFLCLTSTAIAAQAQTAILTAQFNTSRTAANQSENSLTTSNVNASSFGKLYTFHVDGYVYAQPLYVPRLTINGVVKNVLYVATMQNSIYAFDADTAALIFHVSLGTPVPANYASPCPSSSITGPVLGVLSTPTIDLSRSLLYAVSATPNGGGTYVHRIVALDIRTGQIKVGPEVIAPTYPGTGTNHNSNGQVFMNQTHYMQRPGLLLSQGIVYAGFGSCGLDPSPYHGWVVGYDAATLQQRAVYNTSPNGDEDAIWQSGRGLVGDGLGNVYAMTGNGSYNGSTDFSNSFLKLSPLGNLIDWFTPSNDPLLNQYDLDLSSSGPIFTPDTHDLVGGGKQGVVYVLNSAALGMTGPPLQQFQASQSCGTPTYNGCNQIHSMAYLSAGESLLYVWAAHDILRSFQANAGRFSPGAQNSLTVGYPGSMLAISSSGGRSGTSILWAVDPSGVVHAYNALNVSDELWNSTEDASRDSLGTFSKFGQPIIADGRVYVPTFSNAVVAYALQEIPAAPSDLTFDIDFSSTPQVSLSWTDNSNDETGFGIERSTDGVHFAQIATVAANVTTYKDTSVSHNTTYYYRVRALHPLGDSGYSNVIQYTVF